MDINIIPYQAEHHHLFKKLNLEWLDHYQLKEDHDLMILDDPENIVLKNGGYIWMAEIDGVVAGCAGLIKDKEDEYELIKMAVTESYRSNGISKLLIETCIAKAKEMGAKKISLFSNHQLQRAISLYERYGFHHVEPVNSPMLTADVRMEKHL